MKFKIHIGDWSRDGHGHQDVFVVEANKSIKDVREAYFAAKEKLPDCICPENFMSDYLDSSLPEDTYLEAKKHGYNLVSLKKGEVISEEILACPDIGTTEMCAYVVWFIQQGDPGLKLKMVKDLPTLAFYGYDNKDRHIGYFGYGLFGE